MGCPLDLTAGMSCRFLQSARTTVRPAVYNSNSKLRRTREQQIRTVIDDDDGVAVRVAAVEESLTLSVALSPGRSVDQSGALQGPVGAQTISATENAASRDAKDVIRQTPLPARSLPPAVPSAH